VCASGGGCGGCRFTHGGLHRLCSFHPETHSAPKTRAGSDCPVTCRQRMRLTTRSLQPAGLLTAAIILSAAAALATDVPIAAQAASLSVSISGNHFVDGAGRTVRLLGVNRSGTEYECMAN